MGKISIGFFKVNRERSQLGSFTGRFCKRPSCGIGSIFVSSNVQQLQSKLIDHLAGSPVLYPELQDLHVDRPLFVKWLMDQPMTRYY